MNVKKNMSEKKSPQKKGIQWNLEAIKTYEKARRKEELKDRWSKVKLEEIRVWLEIEHRELRRKQEEWAIKWREFLSKEEQKEEDEKIKKEINELRKEWANSVLEEWKRESDQRGKELGQWQDARREWASNWKTSIQAVEGGKQAERRVSYSLYRWKCELEQDFKLEIKRKLGVLMLAKSIGIQEDIHEQVIREIEKARTIWIETKEEDLEWIGKKYKDPQEIEEKTAELVLEECNWMEIYESLVIWSDESSEIQKWANPDFKAFNEENGGVSPWAGFRGWVERLGDGNAIERMKMALNEEWFKGWGIKEWINFLKEEGEDEAWYWMMNADLSGVRKAEKKEKEKINVGVMEALGNLEKRNSEDLRVMEARAWIEKEYEKKAKKSGKTAMQEWWTHFLKKEDWIEMINQGGGEMKSDEGRWYCEDQELMEELEKRVVGLAKSIRNEAQEWKWLEDWILELKLKIDWSRNTEDREAMMKSIEKQLEEVRPIEIKKEKIKKGEPLEEACEEKNALTRGIKRL